jgi:hypothetical protein
MRICVAWSLALAALLLTGCQPASSVPLTGGPAAQSGLPHVLRVGDKAPDFALLDQNRQTVSLSQLNGRPAQIAFYVWAFSGG